MSYKKSDIQKYSDGWWITWFNQVRNKRIQMSGPYKIKDEAIRDMEVLNNRKRK